MIVARRGLRVAGRPGTMPAHRVAAVPRRIGDGQRFLTIQVRPNVVDHVRFEMWNQSQTVLLFTVQLPVYYQYGALHRVFLPIVLK